MTSDPGIICLQHCNTKIFCFQLPLCCPTCNCNLLENDWKNVPFRIPYPFVQASQNPCSIIIRPTFGDFLNEYNNSTDLHIALTTSNGTIVEFDQNGLQTLKPTDKTERHSVWAQSLLIESVQENWYDTWDNTIYQILNQQDWSVKHYDEFEVNCYTFVLAFLRVLSYEELSEAASNKNTFCEKYIIPKTTAAGKYISLYRKIRDQKVYYNATADSKPSTKKFIVDNNSHYKIKKYVANVLNANERRENMWDLRTILE